MRIFYIVVLSMLVMAGLSSCLVNTQYFEHEPTHGFLYPYISEHRLKKMMSKSNLEKLQNFSDKGIVFVPDFTVMDPHFPVPMSHVLIYSRIISSIYIDKAILYSGTRDFKKKLIIKNYVNIDKKFNSIFLRSVHLFGGKEFLQKKSNVTDYDKIWDEDFVILELYYRIPTEGEKGQLKKMEFKLVRKIGSEIAWGT